MHVLVKPGRRNSCGELGFVLDLVMNEFRTERGYLFPDLKILGRTLG